LSELQSLHLRQVWTNTSCKSHQGRYQESRRRTKTKDGGDCAGSEKTEMLKKIGEEIAVARIKVFTTVEEII